MSIEFSVIVAHDANRGIGVENRIPWHLPEDMAYFKKLTTETTDPNKKNIVIMGRKTYDSIPDAYKPLPGRLNLVVSRKELTIPELLTATSIPEALSIAAEKQAEGAVENVFCIGGSQLYAQMMILPECKALYVTKISNSFNCDAHFPSYEEAFSLEKETEEQQSKKGLGYRFLKFLPF